MKLITLLAFAGLFAAVLAANWGPESQITKNRLKNTAFGPAHKVAYGNDGVGHMVWVGEANGQTGVYYKRYYPKTGWTSDFKLTGNGNSPSIVLDNNGKDIHVVWCGYKKGSTYYHVFYQKCVPGGTGTGGWVGAPIDICNNAGYSPADACLAGGPNGQLIVSWVETRVSGADTLRAVQFREYTSGQWQTQQLIDDPLSCNRGGLSTATDGSGNAYVAYSGTRSLQRYDSIHVYANRRIGGVWQQWENVTTPLGYPDSFVVPHIDVDPATGFPHVVFHSYYSADGYQWYYVYHAYRGAAGWTVPSRITNASVIELAPSMVFGADGTAHVLFQHPRGIAYTYRDPQTGEWSAATEIAHNGSFSYYTPSLTMAPGGALYGIWAKWDMSRGFDGPWQIWGSSSPGSFFSGQTTGAAEPVDGLALDVTPNPASRGTRVSYSLPSVGTVALKVYDVGGKLVKTVDCGLAQPGSNAVSLSGLGLARGAYVLKLESGRYSLTRKLVVE